ncbi:hypothetical protein [Coprococcus comes]
MDISIESNLKNNSKEGAKSWRLLKLEKAIAYRRLDSIRYQMINWRK